MSSTAIQIVLALMTQLLLPAYVVLTVWRGKVMRIQIDRVAIRWYRGRRGGDDVYMLVV